MTGRGRVRVALPVVAVVERDVIRQKPDDISWLEVTAGRMDLSLGAVARALDLPIATRPVWIRWRSPDQLDAIEAATGVSSSMRNSSTCIGVRYVK